MIKFNACTRCGGDVHFNVTRRGVLVGCLQRGVCVLCGVRKWFATEHVRAPSRLVPEATGTADPTRQAA